VTDTTPPTALASGTRPRRRPPLFKHPWRIAIVVVGVLAVLNLGALLLNKSDTSTVTKVGTLPDTILSLQPPPGGIIRPQDTITVMLQTDLTGTLVIDGQEVPTNELQNVPELGQVSYRPGPGKGLDQFATGTHHITVEYWLQTKPRPIHPSTYSWTFRVTA
jgi:hypothetical protein